MRAAYEWTTYVYGLKMWQLTTLNLFNSIFDWIYVCNNYQLFLCSDSQWFYSRTQIWLDAQPFTSTVKWTGRIYFALPNIYNYGIWLILLFHLYLACFFPAVRVIRRLHTPQICLRLSSHNPVLLKHQHFNW